MARINFENLPITSDQARAARNYFGWPQAKAAEESGLPLHKLKRFEAESFIRDEAFLVDLRAFYEKRGYKFEDTPEPGASAKQSGMVFPEGVVGAVDGGGQAGRPVKTTVHHMRISLSEEEMGHVLDLIEMNEDRVRALVKATASPGFFDGFSDQTEAQHGDITKLLAANGLLFAKLLGREVGGTPTQEVLDGKEKPKTQGQLLHRVHADTYLAAAGNVEARERLHDRKPASSLSSAIFG